MQFKHIIYATILLVFSFLSTQLAAQKIVPGYFGKKMFISAKLNYWSTQGGINSNGNVFPWNFSEDSGNNKYFASTGHYGLSGGYVIGRYWVAALDIGMGKTGLAEYEAYDNIGKRTYRDIVFSMNHSYVDIGVDRFLKRKSQIAPIGSYFGLRIKRIWVGKSKAKGTQLSSGELKEIPGKTDFDVDFGKKSANLILFRLGFKAPFKEFAYYDIGYSFTPFELGFAETSNVALQRVKKLHGINMYASVGTFF